MGKKSRLNATGLTYYERVQLAKAREEKKRKEQAELLAKAMTLRLRKIGAIRAKAAKESEEKSWIDGPVPP